jgi:hypothetical protein
MTESIADMLVSVCKDILPFYLSEAETEDYPYAVFEYTPQVFRTKDGVYKITADVYIRVYSNDGDEVETKAAAIMSALDTFAADTTDNNGKYIIALQASPESCVEGVWQYELQYFVKQTS